MFAGTVVTAVAAGTAGVEVDPSVGSFSGTAKAGPEFGCFGEDGGTYQTFTEKLKGTSTDALDGSLIPGDFSLTGAMFSTTKLTFNMATRQDWGTGTLTITNAGGTISGPVTVVVQVDGNGNTHARGLWVGKVNDLSGALTGDLSVENFDLVGNNAVKPPTFSGSWGGAPAEGNYSVKTTKVHC